MYIGFNSNTRHNLSPVDQVGFIQYLEAEPLQLAGLKKCPIGRCGGVCGCYVL